MWNTKDHIVIDDLLIVVIVLIKVLVSVYGLVLRIDVILLLTWLISVGRLHQVVIASNLICIHLLLDLAWVHVHIVVVHHSIVHINIGGCSCT